MFIAHKDMPHMTPGNTPVSSSYCQLCGLPEDFCKYGPLWSSHSISGVRPDEAVNVEEVRAPCLTEQSSIKNSGGSIIVKIAPRVGRRYLTTISGLDQFDVDTGKACRVFAKKFACGVGNKDGEIEIQGDFEDSIIETITSNWKKIKAKNISIRRKDRQCFIIELFYRRN
jgi:translation initiation factor 1 (eIF-1/SUI1)